MPLDHGLKMGMASWDWPEGEANGNHMSEMAESKAMSLIQVRGTMCALMSRPLSCDSFEARKLVWNHDP